MTRSRHTAWKAARPLQLSEPLSHRRLKANGGDSGHRTPEERGMIVSGFLYHYSEGQPLPPLAWFTQRFPIPLAYEFTQWGGVFRSK